MFVQVFTNAESESKTLARERNIDKWHARYFITLNVTSCDKFEHVKIGEKVLKKE